MSQQGKYKEVIACFEREHPSVVRLDILHAASLSRGEPPIRNRVEVVKVASTDYCIRGPLQSYRVALNVSPDSLSLAGRTHTSPVILHRDHGIQMLHLDPAQTQTREPFQDHTLEEAMSYFQRVRSSFPNEPKVYVDFLEVVNEYRRKRIDTRGLIEHVAYQFNDHPELIMGFNAFLSPCYQIVAQPNPSALCPAPSPANAHSHRTSAQSIKANVRKIFIRFRVLFYLLLICFLIRLFYANTRGCL